jgi:hypothetical protein
VALDSISLVRSTEPMISITEPETGTRWISGSERHIVWQNSGDLDVIRILFSSDGGDTWTTVTGAASNQKNFWWNIPADISGTDCRIIISDTGGTCADTSGAFSVVDAGTIDAREMVKNGGFLDTTNWYFSVNGPAKASGAFVNDETDKALSRLRERGLHGLYHTGPYGWKYFTLHAQRKTAPDTAYERNVNRME